jgi:putative transcription antitermination factor YqgF
MRILALDISKRKIGIAISDEDAQFIAYATEIPTSYHNLKHIVESYKISLTIVGLPMDFHGSHTQNTHFVKQFTHNARDIIKPFIFVDERSTTNLAESMLGRYQLDKKTAIIILYSYIYRKNNE